MGDLVFAFAEEGLFEAIIPLLNNENDQTSSFALSIFGPMFSEIIRIRITEQTRVDSIPLLSQPLPVSLMESIPAIITAILTRPFLTRSPIWRHKSAVYLLFILTFAGRHFDPFPTSVLNQFTTLNLVTNNLLIDAFDDILRGKDNRQLFLTTEIWEVTINLMILGVTQLLNSFLDHFDKECQTTTPTTTTTTSTTTTPPQPPPRLVQELSSLVRILGQCLVGLKMFSPTSFPYTVAYPLWDVIHRLYLAIESAHYRGESNALSDLFTFIETTGLIEVAATIKLNGVTHQFQTILRFFDLLRLTTHKKTYLDYCDRLYTAGLGDVIDHVMSPGYLDLPNFPPDELCWSVIWLCCFLIAHPGDVYHCCRYPQMFQVLSTAMDYSENNHWGTLHYRFIFQSFIVFLLHSLINNNRLDTNNSTNNNNCGNNTSDDNNNNNNNDSTGNNNNNNSNNGNPRKDHHLEHFFITALATSPFPSNIQEYVEKWIQDPNREGQDTHLRGRQLFDLVFTFIRYLATNSIPQGDGAVFIRPNEPKFDSSEDSNLTFPPKSDLLKEATQVAIEWVKNDKFINFLMAVGLKDDRSKADQFAQLISLVQDYINSSSTTQTPTTSPSSSFSTTSSTTPCLPPSDIMPPDFQQNDHQNDDHHIHAKIKSYNKLCGRSGKVKGKKLPPPLLAPKSDDAVSNRNNNNNTPIPAQKEQHSNTSDDQVNGTE